MQADHDTRDHGGRIDRAMATFGGTRDDWIDLSTGINPVPYPLPDLPAPLWTALPDAAASQALIAAARQFWSVPEGASILPIPGASIAIAQVPRLAVPATVMIRTPSYNEHAAAFQAAGWSVTDTDAAKARVLVHPNNPDGHWFTDADANAPLTVIDESFCDVEPARSLISCTTRPGTIVLKSFGKFWGLAGLRLGFAIGDPDLIETLANRIGPWPVSGPALQIGTHALTNPSWADQTRRYLAAESPRLDKLVAQTGAQLIGGTTLFRLYDHPRAQDLHIHLAKHHIWTRVFPWSDTALRLGLPAPADWGRVATALESFA
ncbi:threonine-phosphate decarboxylase [Pseudooceanicola sp. MF1-13]|uniref:threonine-phosphate decarboxylase n=1 Tax=Pseudooceanicola sp. MF1-13 TaxID=3379095 RepID=UPI003891D8AC